MTLKVKSPQPGKSSQEVERQFLFRQSKSKHLQFRREKLESLKVRQPIGIIKREATYVSKKLQEPKIVIFTKTIGSEGDIRSSFKESVNIPKIRFIELRIKI